MQLTIDTDVTSRYVRGWALVLTISPTNDSAHLAWSPSGYAESETFEIRLGRAPMSGQAIKELRRTFEEFSGLDDIREASWEYFHTQNCWHWADGPWWGAVADLEAQLWRVIDPQL
ncbi:hypothetical protein [Streptomyces noursei]|uniref:hypothetical protein n=1 Tax=Streptomyces noursei TaxID=1971 RepID=UPI00167465DE|nr:hypothetical protein [Streptomyces noursei]MCZ1021369.1 hypothetical protein [Streptomyces noursei]